MCLYPQIEGWWVSQPAGAGLNPLSFQSRCVLEIISGRMGRCMCLADLGYHPYFITHPGYFARNRDSDAPKHVTASMLWSSAGTYYDRAPAFSMLRLDVDGATVAFYTARTLPPNTLVRFDFSPPIRPRRPRNPPPEQSSTPPELPSALPEQPSGLR